MDYDSTRDDSTRDDSTGDFVPRAPRFEVDDSSETIVSVERTGSTDGGQLSGVLVDVSQHGVKLRVPVHLQFEEALQLEIRVRGTDLLYQGVASVRHIRSVDDENWMVGCAIAPPISDETFAYLATAAGKERRQFRRLPIAVEATVRRQAHAEGCVVGLHNLSSGGFCFSSPVQYEIGERVQLAIDGPDDEPRVIEARIRWQVDSPDGSIVGCQFSSRSSYAELCSCLTDQPLQETSVARRAEPTSQLVLVAAVFAMFVPPLITVLLQTSNVSARSEVSLETASFEATSNVRLLQPAVPEPEPLREWVDNTGKHRTEAILVKVTSEYVLLQKAGGRQRKVPLCRLSEADRAYASAWEAYRSR